MLRICSTSARDTSESSSFLKVDPRKKQITLYDPLTCGGQNAFQKRSSQVPPKMFAFDAVFPQDASQVGKSHQTQTVLINGVRTGRVSSGILWWTSSSIHITMFGSHSELPRIPQFFWVTGMVLSLGRVRVLGFQQVISSEGWRDGSVGKVFPTQAWVSGFGSPASIRQVMPSGLDGHATRENVSGNCILVRQCLTPLGSGKQHYCPSEEMERSEGKLRLVCILQPGSVEECGIGELVRAVRCCCMAKSWVHSSIPKISEHIHRWVNHVTDRWCPLLPA